MKTKVFSMIALFLAFACPTFAQNVTFIEIPNPAQTNNTELNSVWGSDANNVFAVGQDGMFLKYNGSAAVQITNPSTEGLLSVSGSLATDVWAVGNNGAVVHYNGSIITSHNIGTTQQLGCVKAFASNDVWTCGNYGVVAHWNGTSWSTISNSYPNFYFAQITGTPNNMYFAGSDCYSPYASRLIHYNGAIFTEILNDPSGSYWGKSSTQDDNLFYLFSTVDTYSYNKTTGVTTKVYEGGSKESYTFGANDMLTVGADSGVVHFDGTDWKVLNSITGFNSVYAPQNNKTNVYFVGRLGGFYRCNLTTGIEETTFITSTFNIYPNPASDQIIIELVFDKKINTKIELFDLVGKQIKLVSSFVGNESKNTVDISDLPSGAYFIKVTTEGNGNFNKKLIITR